MKIAIVGAGPAGLACARILIQAGISVQVFEREQSAQARSQGGTLDLHPQTGQAALKRAGLFSEFEKHARYEGEDMVLADRFGVRHIDISDTETGRPEIDRTALRQILLDSLPEGTIRWNSNLRSAEVGKLHFAHGIEEGFDLIIGADGAWSKVRPLLTPIPPFYSGISGVEIKLRDVDTKHPDISKMVGNGSLFAFGDENGRCLLCQRQGDRSIRIYAMGWKPESWIKDCGINFDDAPTARSAIQDDFKDWAPELQNLIAQCDDDIIPRALYMLPVGLRWPNRPGVTVVGDAAHLMTPFAGEGVNQALHDSLLLAESIIKNQEDVGRATKEYEQAMFQYAQRVTHKTWVALMDRFDEGGTKKMVDRINAGMAAMAASKQQGSEESDGSFVPA